MCIDDLTKHIKKILNDDCVRNTSPRLKSKSKFDLMHKRAFYDYFQ